MPTMTMKDFTFTGPLGIDCAPATEEDVTFEFQPAKPGMVARLRHIADSVTGQGSELFAAVMREAADELENETARLDFLIEHEAYAWHRETWFVSQAAEDGAELTSGTDCETAREAIDAARLAFVEG